MQDQHTPLGTATEHASVSGSWSTDQCGRVSQYNIVRVLEQRGVKGNFCPSTGAGYVAYKKPDYAHALSRSDTDLLMLLFETYGGGASRWCGSSDGDAGQGAEQANQAAVRE